MSKSVVVTGASAGLGRATAHAFGARGDRVALLARGRVGLEAAAQEVRDHGGQALALVCDVSDPRAVEAAAAQAEAAFGAPDVWVNNAMVGALTRFVDQPIDEFAQITDVTYMGVVNGTRAALARMVPRDAGVVIQVGSSLAYRGIPLQAAYCGAKHAIQGFTEAVRCELIHDGVGVHLTMVQMPALNTPQFAQVENRLPKHPMPVPPIYEPEVGADAIVWASEHKRREVWVGASTPAVIMGNALVPTAADHFLAQTGFDGQQAEFGPDGGRSYVFEPREEDMGTRGRFSADAKDRSAQLELTKLVPDWAAGKLAAGVGHVAGALQKRLGG